MTKNRIITLIITIATVIISTSAKPIVKQTSSKSTAKQINRDIDGFSRLAISTDLVDWANLGTINGEINYGIAQRVTASLQGRYNAWSFRYGKPNQFQNKKLAVNLGCRIYPWYIYSGLYIRPGIQWERYNAGGMFHRQTQEGDAYGATIAIGYDWMIGPHLNIGLAAQAYGGATKYVLYTCPKCGKITNQGVKAFLKPDLIQLHMMYIF